MPKPAIPDGGLQVLLPAVDRNDARAAIGEKPDGCGSDDAGGAGDDGDLAVQANSIGHVGSFPLLVRLFRISWFGAWRANFRRCDYFIRGAA